MKTHKGECPLCGEDYCNKNYESGHHILPRRFFPKSHERYYMCRKCHNHLERRIPQKKKLKASEYREILQDFISEKQFILNYFKERQTV